MMDTKNILCEVNRLWHSGDYELVEAGVKLLRTIPRRQLVASVKHVVTDQLVEDTFFVEALLHFDASYFFVVIADSFDELSEHAIRRLCELLQEFPVKSSGEVLQRIAINNPNPSTRVEACFALGVLGLPDARPLLKKLVRSDFEKDYEGITVSEAAASALRKLHPTPS